ncbi:MAG: hypothetical protein IKN82_10625 [Treponema sp.]|nr:hypothetical protein [Treponema sp.]
MAEFNKRAGADGKWQVLYDEDDGSLEKHFPNPGGSVHIYKVEGDSEIELDLAKNTLMVWNLPGWMDKVDFCSWHTMDDFFAQNVNYAKEWKENLVSLIKENLAQVFHPTKVILLKDSSSWEHEMLGGVNLEVKGDTIKEALARNSMFEEPCAVLKNDEAFGHSKDLRQPIYVFDL